MAKKEDLKGLLEQYFPNNDTGEITEPKIREFLGKVIDLIPEIAGGDLAAPAVRRLARKDYRCEYFAPIKLLQRPKSQRNH